MIVRWRRGVHVVGVVVLVVGVVVLVVGVVVVVAAKWWQRRWDAISIGGGVII